MSTSNPPPVPAAPPGFALPGWARSLAELYASNAASQFIVYGNVSDRMVLPAPPTPRLGGLSDFLLDVLLPLFVSTNRLRRSDASSRMPTC